MATSLLTSLLVDFLAMLVVTVLQSRWLVPQTQAL
jgi:hypothetical protein